MDIGSVITQELEIETAFTIRCSVVYRLRKQLFVMWIIMAVMIVGGFLVTRNFKVENCSKRQLVVESIYKMLDGFFRGLVGERGAAFIPYLIIIICFLFI